MVDVDNAKLQYMIVPLDKDLLINFDYVDEMLAAPKIDWDQVPKEPFVFDRNRYLDAVVIPWYRPLGKLNPFYVDSVTEMNCLNFFPDSNTKTYFDYFQKKYEITISDPYQLLIDTSREITGKNFLIPRYLFIYSGLVTCRTIHGVFIILG